MHYCLGPALKKKLYSERYVNVLTSHRTMIVWFSLLSSHTVMCWSSAQFLPFFLPFLPAAGTGFSESSAVVGLLPSLFVSLAISIISSAIMSCGVEPFSFAALSRALKAWSSDVWIL